MVNDMVGPHITVAELKRALESARDEAIVGIWIPPNIETHPLWSMRPVLLGTGPVDGPVFRLFLHSDAAKQADREASEGQVP